MLLAWLDDVLILVPPTLVEKAQQELEAAFMCKQEGPLMECVGSKISVWHDDIGLGTIKVMQHVLLHKLWDLYQSYQLFQVKYL